MNHCCMSIKTWADVCKILLGQRAWNSVISLDVTTKVPLLRPQPCMTSAPVTVLRSQGLRSGGWGPRPSSSRIPVGTSPWVSPWFQHLRRAWCLPSSPAEARGASPSRCLGCSLLGLAEAGTPNPLTEIPGVLPPTCPNHTHLVSGLHSQFLSLRPRALPPGPLPLPRLSVFRVTPALRGPLPTLRGLRKWHTC